MRVTSTTFGKGNGDNAKSSIKGGIGAKKGLSGNDAQPLSNSKRDDLGKGEVWIIDSRTPSSGERSLRDSGDDSSLISMTSTCQSV